MIGIIMNIGMILVVAGAVPSMIAVLRTRNKLKGFSMLGLAVNVAANFCFGVAQALLGIWVSVALNIVMIAYTLAVMFYVWRCRR